MYKILSMLPYNNGQLFVFYSEVFPNFSNWNNQTLIEDELKNELKSSINVLSMLPK